MDDASGGYGKELLISEIAASDSEEYKIVVSSEVKASNVVLILSISLGVY